ncbi:MAG: hypothetical protein DRP64_00575 [Verrucomicrobia bacterium]|nr:MAG: hypothetical protein DRP64_00575 [Verrucomicrobiota bacterium]
MKIRLAIAAMVVAVGFAAHAGTNTIAYWRFEEGTAGWEHAGDLDNWYQDSSGNGNHLSNPAPDRRPMATADRPFMSIPPTGADNNLALDFDGDSNDEDELGTYGPGNKMIESYMFTNGWTVECSFKLHSLGWDVLVGKDGRRGDLGGVSSGHPPFVLRIDNGTRNRGRLFSQFVDNDNNVDANFSFSSDPIDLNKWYSAAVTYDNLVLRLYLKAEGYDDYILMDSKVATSGASFGQYNRSWTVGRGMWNGGASDYIDGLVDEVRISNVALDPTDFINAVVVSNSASLVGPTCSIDAGQFYWSSTNDAFYAVERSANLISNDWQTVTNGITATPNTNSVPLPSPEQESEFYRLVVSNGVWPIPTKTVVLTFDDAVQSHLDYVAPLLTNYGFRATFFITSLWMGDTVNFMSWEDIAALHQMGFEIGNHTSDHYDYSLASTTNRLRDTLNSVTVNLASNGLPTPVSFAWPMNNFSPECRQVLMDEGYLFARRGMQPEEPYGENRFGPLYDPTKHDPLLIPTTADAYPDWTMDHFKAVMAQATPGKVIVLQFHGVPDVAHPWVSTPPVMFEQYMAYLAEEGFNVVAMCDLASYVDSGFDTHDPTLLIRWPVWP